MCEIKEDQTTFLINHAEGWFPIYAFGNCTRKCMGQEVAQYPRNTSAWDQSLISGNNYTPRFNEVERGVYWYHLVRLSVCGQNRVRSVSSTILIGSISYLHILSSNFRRCVACKVRSKFKNFGEFFIFETLTGWKKYFVFCLLLTWDPIWLNGMGNHEEASGGILRTQAF